MWQYLVIYFSPALTTRYNISTSDYYADVYNETSEVNMQLAFLDRGTDPPRGTVVKPKFVLSNSCLMDVLFQQIQLEADYDNTTGGVYLRIPKYWIDFYGDYFSSHVMLN